MNELAPAEQFAHLAEEITAIRAQHAFNAGMEAWEMRHEIGSAILASPLYRKHGKNQHEFFATVANITGMGDRSLRYCVEFAARAPSFKKFMEEYADGHKLPVWREYVQKELPSGKHERPEPQPKCRHCPEHCPNQ